MIEIQLKHAVPLYSALLGVVFLAIWIYTEITTRRTYRHFSEQFLWRCTFCGYAYLDEDAEVVSPCPRCGSYNEPGRKRSRALRAASGQTGEKKTSDEDEKSKRNPSRRKRPHQRRRGPRRR